MTTQKSTTELVSWNVNGLRACRKKTFDQFVETRMPDMLCLQEVKLNESVIPEEDFGYAFRHYHLAEKKAIGHRGFFQEETTFSERGFSRRQTHGGRKGDHLRVRWVLPRERVRSNSKGDLSRLPYRYDSWDPDLKDYLIDLRREKPVVLCGDLNAAHREIDLANLKTNRKNAGFTDEEREGLSNLLAEGFLDSFRHLYPDEEGPIPGGLTVPEPVRETPGGGLIILSFPMISPLVRDACILPEWEGSDHCPVGLSLTLG